MTLRALPNVAAYAAGVQTATLRQWVRRGHISPPVHGCYDLDEVQRHAHQWHARIAELREQVKAPLPRSQMLAAADLALMVEIDVNTVYVWTTRGILHRHRGLYDWREAVLWLMVRNPGRISEPLATRAAM